MRLSVARSHLIALVGTVILGGCSSSISWDEAAAKVGDDAEVCGALRSVSFDSDSEATFFNLGRDYPDPDRFTIVVWSSEPDLAESYQWATEAPAPTICAEGTVSSYKGVAQIELDSDDNIAIQPNPEDGPDISDEIPGPY
ncbi:hypothetical protein IEZ26_06595 [Nocardioides cavernae]|uniref:DUF3558 domain-containing protein n=1 Tax=Nocardioides cavernae TaxID=1921566 RepID=A0ABR8NBN9_9ACTN|nr:hypothetical protein [Nocardioides cavernae]MBD3924284.1 hypothetical protein [Nocardioides cavernae]MBM7510774.1 hypothetical protein [Nocardioides cavernae]